MENSDEELAAINAIVAALSPLNTQARQRALDYILKRFEMPSAEPVAPGAQNIIEQPVPPAKTQSSRGSMDIRTLKDEKQPETAIQMAVLVAYYLEELAPEKERKVEIGIDEIKTYFKQANFPLPKSAKNTLSNAKAAGYLQSADRGLYRLNPVGFNLAAYGLPSTGSRGPKPLRKKAKKSQTKKRK